MTIIYASQYAELMGWNPPDVALGIGVPFPLPGAFSVSCDLDNVDSGNELWVHGKFRTLAPPNTPTISPVLSVLAGPVTFSVNVYANNPKLAAKVATLAPTGGSTSGAPYAVFASPTVYFFDLRCRYSGGNAIAEFYVNNALVSTASRTADPANFQTATWGNDLGVRAFAETNTVFVSDFLVATEDTRGANIVTLQGDRAAGHYSQWTGDSAEIADFLPLTGVTAETEGLKETRMFGPGGDGAIRALIVATRFLPSPGAARLSSMFRIGGVDYFGSPQSPSVGAPAQIVATVFETNPATGVAWVAADIGDTGADTAALDAGFRSELP